MYFSTGNTGPWPHSGDEILRRGGGSLTLAMALFGEEEGKKHTFSVLSHSVRGIKALYDQTFRSEMEILLKSWTRPSCLFRKEFLAFCDLDYAFDFYLAAVNFVSIGKKKEYPLLPISSRKKT